MLRDSPRIQELRRRVESDPASTAFAQLAEEHRRAGDHQEAVELCRTGLARHPGYLTAHVILGRALSALERWDEAAEEFTLVLRSAPDNLVAARGLDDIARRRNTPVDLDVLLTSMGQPNLAPPASAEMLLTHQQEAVPVDAFLPEDPQLADGDEPLADLERKLREFEQAPAAPAVVEPDDPVLAELEAWLTALSEPRDRASRRSN